MAHMFEVMEENERLIEQRNEAWDEIENLEAKLEDLKSFDAVSDFFRWLDDEGYISISQDRQLRILTRYVKGGK